MTYTTEWQEYYIYLSNLQKKTGSILGATLMLQERFDLQKRLARTILSSYMSNYDDLVKDGVINGA